MEIQTTGHNVHITNTCQQQTAYKEKNKDKKTHNDTIKHETRLDSSQESFCFVIVHKLKRTTNVIQMGSTFIEYIFIYFLEQIQKSVPDLFQVN